MECFESKKPYILNLVAVWHYWKLLECVLGSAEAKWHMHVQRQKPERLGGVYRDSSQTRKQVPYIKSPINGENVLKASLGLTDN